MSLRSGLERILEPIRIQVRNIVSRSLVQLVKDDKNIQLVQLSILKLSLIHISEPTRPY